MRRMSEQQTIVERFPRHFHGVVRGHEEFVHADFFVELHRIECLSYFD